MSGSVSAALPREPWAGEGSAVRIDGTALAARTLDELRGRIDRLHEHGIRPGLGTIMVGANPGSMSYVAGKHRDSASIGLDSHRIDLPETASAADIRAAILQMNDDPRVTAFIVQLPLPQGIDPTPMLELMDPAKDADGLHPTNLGELVLAVPGGAGTIDAPLPCTPRGIVAMLDAYEIPIRGAHVTIIGQGLTVGRPLGLLLTRLEATATLTHSLTADVAAECRRADIIVAAAGSPGSSSRTGCSPVPPSSTWGSPASSTRRPARRSCTATSTPRSHRSRASCRRLPVVSGR